MVSWKGGLLLAFFCAQILCLSFAAQVDVWPYPSQASAGEALAAVKAKDFAFKLDQQPTSSEDAALLRRAFSRYHKLTFPSTPTLSSIAYRNNIFADRINGSNPTLTAEEPFASAADLKHALSSLRVTLANLSHVPLALGVDESYELSIDTTSASSTTLQAHLSANTVWGVLRGLESFSQLVRYHYFESDGSATFTVHFPISINDSPRFPWRGLMLDTARHYLPLSLLKRSLDAMSYNKLNVLHWHLVDAESFPFQSQTFPKLSEKGAYAPKAIYTAKDIKDLIAYAKDRGIRIVAEVDTPGHSASWGQGYPHLIANCYDYLKSTNHGKLAWPTWDKVALDVTRNDTRDFMVKLLDELLDVFEDEYFHIGGDEVYGPCWNDIAHIRQWAQDHGFATLDPATGEYTYDWQGVQNQWMDFVQEQVHEHQERKSIVWDEVFSLNMNVRPDTVVHAWQKPDIIPEATAKNFKVINSWGWYMDRQAPTCQGSTCQVNWMWMWTWRDMYRVEPFDFFPTPPTQQQQDLILGGEAASWHESVDESNLEQRVFSRLPAVSERLWSPKELNDADEAQPRLASFQCKIGRRGIRAAPTEPSYCEYTVFNQAEEAQSSSSWSTLSKVMVAVSSVLLIANIVTCFLFRRASNASAANEPLLHRPI